MKYVGRQNPMAIVEAFQVPDDGPVEPLLSWLDENKIKNESARHGELVICGPGDSGNRGAFALEWIVLGDSGQTTTMGPSTFDQLYKPFGA